MTIPSYGAPNALYPLQIEPRLANGGRRRPLIYHDLSFSPTLRRRYFQLLLADRPIRDRWAGPTGQEVCATRIFPGAIVPAKIYPVRFHSQKKYFWAGPTAHKKYFPDRLFRAKIIPVPVGHEMKKISGHDCVRKNISGHSGVKQ